MAHRLRATDVRGDKCSSAKQVLTTTNQTLGCRTILLRIKYQRGSTFDLHYVYAPIKDGTPSPDDNWQYYQAAD